MLVNSFIDVDDEYVNSQCPKFQDHALGSSQMAVAAVNDLEAVDLSELGT